MKTQMLYELQEETGFTSGKTLQEFFKAMIGEPSPSGHREIPDEEALRFIAVELGQMSQNSYETYLEVLSQVTNAIGQLPVATYETYLKALDECSPPLTSLWGVDSVPHGVPTVKAPARDHGESIPRHKRFKLGVLVEDECHAHPWGTALKVNGEWYWRGADSRALQPIENGLKSKGGIVRCHCPIG